MVLQNILKSKQLKNQLALGEDMFDYIISLYDKETDSISYYQEENLTYNDKYPTKIRELIYSAIVEARKKDFDIKKFFKSDNKLPAILSGNVDFILYLISNDINNTVYLTESLLNKQTISGIEQIVKTILESLKSGKTDIDVIEKNTDLSIILNRIDCKLDYIHSYLKEV